MMSPHVEVRDPPSVLRPPLEEFGETIKYEKVLQLTLSESSSVFEPSEASLAYSFLTHHKPVRVSMIPRLATSIENVATVDVWQGNLSEPAGAQNNAGWSRSSTPVAKPKVLKKRRSLQSLFTPSFLHTFPTAPATAPPKLLARTHSHTAPRQPSSTPVINTKSTPLPPALDTRSASPSTFLIDDDPFANIRTPPSATGSHKPPLDPTPPSSSVDPAPAKPAEATIPPSPILPLPAPSTRPTTPSRPKSSGYGQVRGAYTKPAFTSRPSLPSLHTLAQMNVVVPKKTRKGTVGARLPYEPWNMDLNELNPITIRRSTSLSSSSTDHIPEDGSTTDTLHLGTDVSDVTSTFEMDNEEDPEPCFTPFTDGEFLPSLSYTPSEPSVYSLSRSSSSASVSSSAPRSIDQMNPSSTSVSDLGEFSNDYDYERYHEHDPLQSEPDFDYYWQPSPVEILSPPEPKSRSRSCSPSMWPEVGRTPHPSFYFDDNLLDTFDPLFEPGTSANTIRNNLHDTMGSARPESPLLPEPRSFEQEMVDGSGWDGRHGDGYRGNGGDRDYRHRDDGGRGGSGGGAGGNGRGGNPNGNNYGAGGGGRGGRDGDGDDRRDWRSDIKSCFSTPSDSESDEEEEESETSTDDYGIDSAPPSVLAPPLVRTANPIPDSPSETSAGTDDDVPLAQRIPTALKAQKTIRKQVRDERDRRRRERGADGSTARQLASHTSPGKAGIEQPVGSTSSQPAALHSSRPMGRPRTKTMPSNTSRPLAVDDLTKKLLNVQAAGSPPAAMSQSKVPQGRDLGNSSDEHTRRKLSFQPISSSTTVAAALRPSSSQGRDHQRTSANDQFPFGHQSRPSLDRPNVESGSRDQGLRPMKSLHGLSSKASEGYHGAPVESGFGQRLGRSVTSARSRRADDAYLNIQSNSLPRTSFDSRLSVDKPRSHRTSEETARPSIGGHTPASAEHDSSSSPQRNSSRPPMPPLPTAEVLSNLAQSSSTKPQLTSQRIFIENKQRFNMVETGPSTNAGEVVQMVESQAALEKLSAGSGAWMLWEVAQDFGMERPIRDYELLSDVEASWNKDKLVNIFVIKKTPLASILSRSAIPPSSPKTQGYVQWESKRGKWNKRWMELREHCLWLAKRDTGKDESLLCSLSNFDVYYAGKLHKAPKPFVFAVKSADNLSLFENASDYVHFFSCGQKDGETWMQAILLARSYVLYQERNILFAPRSVAGGSNAAATKPLSRSGTRKQRPSHLNQPLVNVATSFTVAASPSNAVFEPGSLLAKRRDI